MFFQCCRVIVACCVLYNLRKRFGMDEEDEEQDGDDEANDDDDGDQNQEEPNVNGHIARQNIVQNYF